MTLELIGGVVALIGVIASAIFGNRKSSPVLDAQLEADKAKQDAVTAKADLAKEIIKHDTEKALAAAAALSDDDILNDALKEYRANRPGGEPGGINPEGAGPYRQ